jgi:hypothetical protein
MTRGRNHTTPVHCAPPRKLNRVIWFWPETRTSTSLPGFLNSSNRLCALRLPQGTSLETKAFVQTPPPELCPKPPCCSKTRHEANAGVLPSATEPRTAAPALRWRAAPGAGEWGGGGLVPGDPVALLRRRAGPPRCPAPGVAMQCFVVLHNAGRRTG